VVTEPIQPHADIHAALLALREDSPDYAAGIVALHELATNSARRAREILSMIEQAAIDHIESTGADIPLPNGERWYLKQVKTYREVAPSQTLMALLEAVDHDHTRLCTGDHGVLAANAYKIGAAKAVLGDKFAEVFREEVSLDLATGKAKRKLATTNSEFARKRLSADSDPAQAEGGAA
jgi:hypothetical protein